MSDVGVLQGTLGFGFGFGNEPKTPTRERIAWSSRERIALAYFFLGNRKMTRNKSERAKAVEKLVSEEANEDEMCKCMVENCGVIVKCASNNGAPGRTSHVRSSHKEEYDKLPKPTETQKRGADEENRPSQKTKVERWKPEGILVTADKENALFRECKTKK